MMETINNFINQLKGKSIHLVGVSGSEGSNILRFLVKHGITRITAHDFSQDSLEKNFKLWHKNILPAERNKLYGIFRQDLEKVKYFSDTDYLKDITHADMIFVPQSWRMYGQNQPLWKAKKKEIPFHSLTQLYLALSPALTVGITGTVGKGSVANLIYQLCKKTLPEGRKVYFAGNDTWRPQIADKLHELRPNDIIILEISHRQLMDGITKSPHIAVLTNIYPNHLDEVSWEEYRNLKLSLFQYQSKKDFAVLNYDCLNLRKLAYQIHSQKIYYSSNNIKKNTKSIQLNFRNIMNNIGDQYTDNILSTVAVTDLLSMNITQRMNKLKSIPVLPARMEFLGKYNEIKLYDDIKSTTPWATMAAVRKISSDIILICGGKTKNISYTEFINEVKKHAKYIILLKSELSDQIRNLLPKNIYSVGDSLEKAVQIAFNNARKDDNIIISPSAAFFYTDFIKGKKSLRRIIQELFRPHPIIT